MSLFGPPPRTLGGIAATRPMRRVLLVLLTDATNLSGFTFMRTAGLNSGKVYTCLARLENEGWIVGEFADGPHPRRRLYRLTPAGWTSAYELLGLDKPEAHRG